jgi:hypothetical protein
VYPCYNKKEGKGKTQTQPRNGERTTWRDQHPSKARNTTAHHSNRGNSNRQGRNPTSRNGKNSRGKPPRRGKPHARTDQPEKPNPATSNRHGKNRRRKHPNPTTFFFSSFFPLRSHLRGSRSTQF